MIELTLADIADVRAYERQRDAFRAEVMELKKTRRLPIGPIVSVVFENRTTVLFQVQEMARAEGMLRDDQIQGELDAYNPLIPGAGELSMTLFIELTSPAELREWLPRLLGVERSVYLAVGVADQRLQLRTKVDPTHAAHLTRETATSSVHYVRIQVPDDLTASFAAGPVAIGIDHPDYRHETSLPPDTISSLISDWTAV